MFTSRVYIRIQCQEFVLRLKKREREGDLHINILSLHSARKMVQILSVKALHVAGL